MVDQQPAFMIRFRDATMNDADLLLRWRNDPLTRMMSKGSDAIDIEEHVRWLNGVIKDKCRQLYIAFHEDRAIGTMRVDWSGDSVGELSWTIAPEARGDGYGRVMVHQFCRMVGGRLRATIRADNDASRKIAIYAGLSLCNGGNADLEYYEGEF